MKIFGEILNWRVSTFNNYYYFFPSLILLVSKFWQNLTIKLAKVVKFALKRQRFPKFSQLLCWKMTKSRQKKNIAFANSRRFHKDHHSVNLLQFSSKYLLWMKCGHCWMSFIHLSDKEQGWVNFLCIEWKMKTDELHLTSDELNYYMNILLLY
jgi:hypothetical protein